MIRATYKTAGAKSALQNIAKGMNREAINRLVQRVALIMFSQAVAITPVRWFGAVRASWQFRPTPTGAIIQNNNRAFLFIDQGTRDHGPVTKRFLYVPLTKTAAAGWRPGLKRGIDYILTKKVRGIKAQHIIARLREAANALLKQEFKNYLRDLIRNPEKPPQGGLATPIPGSLLSSSPLPSGLAAQVPVALLSQPRLPFLRR